MLGRRREERSDYVVAHRQGGKPRVVEERVEAGLHHEVLVQKRSTTKHDDIEGCKIVDMVKTDVKRSIDCNMDKEFVGFMKSQESRSSFDYLGI